MKKEIKIAMITAFLLLSVSSISASDAAVYNITNDSYANYFDTTGYINDTSIVAGDVLDLSGTISNKNINVDRPLNITSTDKTAQILNGTITIYTAGSGTNVTDLTIINHNENGNGIFLYQTQNCTIQGNHIYCDGPLGFAIPITRSHHNNIIGNTITMCERDDTARTHTAIVLGSSNYNTITDNYIQSDGANCIYLSIWGSGLFESDGPSYHNNIINNSCVCMDTSWCYAIQMMGSYNIAQNNTILSQTFPEKKSSYGTGAYRGISSENDEEGGNTITGNIISATYCGIYANSKCTVSGNTVSSYKDANTATYTNNNGITAGNNCTVTDNILNMASGGYGINLQGSNTTVTGNTISNVVNGHGIYLVGSNNTVTENEVTTTDTSKQSIYIYDASTGNNISQNTINSNTTGIMLKKKTTTKKPTNTTINQNIITTTSTYAVDSYEGSSTIITNNYLFSSNGQGDSAVRSISGDTVSNNYGNPVADFTATPTIGTAPLQVAFNNTSSGTITSYAWDFDNNGTTDSSETNPIWTFNTPGTYTVKLTATNLGGDDEEVKTDYITVNPSLGIINTRTGQYYSTIPEAINDTLTLDGDIITVPNGMYNENIIVNKQLTLNTTGSVTIQPANTDLPIFTVNTAGSGSTITGFTITGAANSSGISLESSNNCHITNNVITGNYVGMKLYNSNQNTITGNTIQNNGWTGICLDQATGNTINNGNEVAGNQEGIFLANNSSSNTIQYNNIHHNNGVGINILSSSNNNQILSNTASSNGVMGIFIQNSNTNTISGNTIQNNGWTGICLDQATGNTINNANVMSDNQEGVFLANASTGNTIEGNNIHHNNGVGINILSSSNNNQILSNTASSNGMMGIFIQNSNTNTIRSNTVQSNDWAGICLDNATGNTINNANVVSDNQEGIFLANNSNGNFIQNNTIGSNKGNGINILNSNTNNIGSNNQISSNGVSGIFIQNSTSTIVYYNTMNSNGWGGVILDTATNTTVYNNNFNNNYEQALAVNGTGNKFYEGTGGNYWSDWTTTDPRPIDGNENLYDQYPHTTPF